MSLDLVKELRDKTGISIMQCKKALEQAGGDIEKALMMLRKASTEAAAKKADREIGAGRIVALQNETGTVVLALLCETDFVAKNDDFVALSQALAEKVLSEGVEATTADAPEMINAVIQKTGENVKLGTVDYTAGTNVGVYVHNDALGARVTTTGGSPELLKDLAMHIAAMKPGYLTREDIPAETRQKAVETFGEEVAKENKPEEMKAKILEGKINAYFKEQTLLEQSFIKDNTKTIAQLLKENGAIEILSFNIQSV
jgi:elongation factor Ts